MFGLAALLILSVLAIVWGRSADMQAQASDASLSASGIPMPVSTATPGIPTATNTPPPGSTATHTPRPGTPTNTPGIPTPVPTDYVSPTPTITPTPCAINFSDVLTSDWFYDPVQWIVCNHIASGYSDGTFRPGNNTTRAQLTKFVVLASGWTLLDPALPHFSDVPRTYPFYGFIETAAYYGAIGGYSDGTFKPGNDVTRSQLSKIIVLARGWTQVIPPTATFTDVPVDSPFFSFVETAVQHTIISGYADHTFRPGLPATRAQLSKIIQRAFSP